MNTIELQKYTYHSLLLSNCCWTFFGLYSSGKTALPICAIKPTGKLTIQKYFCLVKKINEIKLQIEQY